MGYPKCHEDIERRREENLFMKYGSMLAREKDDISTERKTHLEEVRKLRLLQCGGCI